MLQHVYMGTMLPTLISKMVHVKLHLFSLD